MGMLRRPRYLQVSGVTGAGQGVARARTRGGTVEASRRRRLPQGLVEMSPDPVGAEPCRCEQNPLALDLPPERRPSARCARQRRADPLGQRRDEAPVGIIVVAASGPCLDGQRRRTRIIGHHARDARREPASAAAEAGRREAG